MHTNLTIYIYKAHFYIFSGDDDVSIYPSTYISIITYLSISVAPVLPELTGPVEVVEGGSRLVNLTAAGNPTAMDYRWTGPHGLVVNGLSGEDGLSVNKVIGDFLFHCLSIYISINQSIH